MSAKRDTSTVLNILLSRRAEGGGSGEEGGSRKRSRKPRKPRQKKEKVDKKKDNPDGLTAKQRRKVVSKAFVSSSSGSESEGEKLKIDER